MKTKSIIKKLFIIVLFWLVNFVEPSSFTIHSQSHWDSLPGPGHFQTPNSIYAMYADSNYLYAAGKYNELGGKHIQGIARWNGARWDSMGAGVDGLQFDTLSQYPAPIFSMTYYQNKLYVGGGFSSLGDVKAACIGTWDGVKWDTLPIQPFSSALNNDVITMSCVNNKLYIAGGKNRIKGLPGFTGVAVWNDTNWRSLNFPQFLINQNFGNIASLIEYKGDLYAAGIFCNTCNNSDTNECMLRWNGSNWIQVGGGIKGAFDWPMCMAVYNESLYVAGYFWKADGNIGNCIQRWDGNNWHEVGGGLNLEVGNLQVYHNKLYVMGDFDSAGGIYAPSIAIWNDTNWCSIDTDISGSPLASCIYKDSLYVGGGFGLYDGGDTILFCAEWTGGDYTVNCQNNDLVGYEELRMKNEEIITAYPNPNNGIFTIQMDNGQWTMDNDKIEIYNVYGQEIAPFYLSLYGGTTFSYNINMSSEPNGIYFYRVLNSDGTILGSGKVVVDK